VKHGIGVQSIVDHVVKAFEKRTKFKQVGILFHADIKCKKSGITIFFSTSSFMQKIFFVSRK
jgi:hypothetical protein